MTINWVEQWENFAEGFREGKAHIDLSRFGIEKTLLLIPGPGFGDLSHPTTYLMLQMMQGKVRGESIVDIGTGSGILALASLLMGADSAIGIDIEEEALHHARENALLNNLLGQVHFSNSFPDKLPSDSLFLMNMILQDQKLVHPERFHSFAKLWIVSGILEEQKEDYLTMAAKWGWAPESEQVKNGWIGWVFRPRMRQNLF